jgi:fumarate hydratase class II
MPATNRVEHDSMGALEVPANALWGAQTQRAVQNFPSTGLRIPRAFIRAMGLPLTEGGVDGTGSAA